jgi:eukaryotic-like serine/threonine-protein kinase
MRQTLGHYQILEQIGSGGMGVVYRARDDRLERTVAIKVLSADSLADESGRRRFRREALALSKLNHPNIATIYDFDNLDGVDALVMEDISGETLDEKLARGALPEDEVVRLGRQLLTGLAAAHDRHVIHCDLKPGNVRVTQDGRLKILDFGLARALRVEEDATTASAASSLFAGTLPYMAPEQFASDRTPDARTDIYAAGAVLFEMATGRRPYGELEGAPLLSAILNGSVPSARQVNPRVSERLDAVIRKALDKNPALRYQTAREFLVDLERLAGGDAPVFHHRATPRRTRAIVSAAIVVIVLVTGWLGYREWPRHIVQPNGWILIGDFDNSSGIDDLGPVVRDALTLQLQQSRLLNVLSRDQVIDALHRMERPDGQLLDTATALELCQREAIPRLLTGTIQKHGTALWVAVTGRDAVSQSILFTADTEFKSEGQLFDHLDGLVKQIRQGLGESSAAVSEKAAPLANVTTKNINALKLYSQGADRMARGDADAARTLLLQALTFDEQFSMAHGLIARVYETLGNLDQEREHLAKAYALRQNLTERERLHVEASYHRGRGEYQLAVDSLTAAVNLFPSDGEARYELAVAHRDNGETQKAIDDLEATLQNDPFVTVAYADLVALLARTGKYDRAAAVYKQAQARNVHTARLTLAHGLLLLDEGQIDSARTAFEELGRTSEVNAGAARLYLVNADILQGRLNHAIEQLRGDVLIDTRSQNRAAEVKRRYALQQLLQLTGNAAGAREQVAAMLEAGKERLTPTEWQLIGTALVSLGDARRGLEALQHLDQLRRESNSHFAESCYQNLAGEIALATGHADAAIAAFTAAAAQYPRAVSTRGLARTYAAERNWSQARDAWQTAAASKGEFIQEGSATDWVLSLLDLARVSRQSGDLPLARTSYDRFLSLWRVASDAPIVRAADAERGALEAHD